MPCENGHDCVRTVVLDFISPSNYTHKAMMQRLAQSDMDHSSMRTRRGEFAPALMAFVLICSSNGPLLLTKEFAFLPNLVRTRCNERRG